MKIPDFKIPIQKIPINANVELYIKREDLIHPEISGNKYWKLFHNINNYLNRLPQKPLLITFGGAYSNHIASTAAVGSLFKVPTMGIIRGDELVDNWQDNPTLAKAYDNGMLFRFVSREEYRDKEKFSRELSLEFPNALLVPEGGTNLQAVEGIANMLNSETQYFNYLCVAVGTGGTLSGLSKFAEASQEVLGFKVVKDRSLEDIVKTYSDKENLIFFDASIGGYGKINTEIVRFINRFYEDFQIPLEPIYTGKMMMKLLELIDDGFFPKGSKILAFHTGGLQGIEGANDRLKKLNKLLIKVKY